MYPSDMFPRRERFLLYEKSARDFVDTDSGHLACGYLNRRSQYFHLIKSSFYLTFPGVRLSLYKPLALMLILLFKTKEEKHIKFDLNCLLLRHGKIRVLKGNNISLFFGN